ncbi:LADA_0C10858g1_1 [Lachancea dasiensis]|uniref:LADA_0C10858g1_1 n=1 Tax=Lachancea dasiensis TaxID=1072105 RepID=A0A1G4J1I0_9SACH|nr:LADA_0C10858g1_1 [Lachancea dasiensis]
MWIFSEIKEVKMRSFNSRKPPLTSNTRTSNTRSCLSLRTPQQQAKNVTEEEEEDENQPFITQSETDIDTTIGVISVNGSVIHYSINASSTENVEPQDQQGQNYTTPTVGEKGELTLKLLNIYLSLFITDANFAQGSSHMCSSTRKPIDDNNLSHDAFISSIPDSIGPLVDVIGLTDGIIQNIAGFLRDTTFQNKCQREEWNQEDLIHFRSQITLVMKTLILKYAPQASLSPTCHQFDTALMLLRKLQAVTHYWKKSRRTQDVDARGDWILYQLQKLQCVPPPIIESLNVDIMMPAFSTRQAKSSTGEIETLETFTTLYAILLMELKKLFQSMVAISETTGILPQMDCALLNGCLEGFLRNAFISGSTELLVDLDKLVLIWTQSSHALREGTGLWAHNFIDRWNLECPDPKSSTVLGSTTNLSNCDRVRPEYDLVRLFIREIADICMLGTECRTELLESATLRVRAPNSGLGWLTIFQDDRPHTSRALTAREIETLSASQGCHGHSGLQRLQGLYGGEFSLLEDETTMNATKVGPPVHFWSRNRHHRHRHHHSHHFRDWIKRGFRAADVGHRHRLVDKCHRANAKLKSLAHRVYGCDHLTLARQTTPVVTRRSHPPHAAFRLEEAYDHTTYSETLYPLRRRYQNLRRKKDRFMFLFFGEER